MTRSANRCARRCACLTVLAGLCLTALAQADEPKKPKPRFTPISEVTKGMQSEDGLFTVYRVAASDKNRDPEKLLCKIPKAFLKEDLLFATSISSGGSFTSWMWRDNLIRFEIVGKQLRIVTPETRYVQKKNDPVSDVVERTYRDRYIAVVPIVAMTNHGDPVIDLEKLLKSDLAGVSFLGGRVRPELSTWNKVKIFPNNVLIDVDLALGTADSGQTVGVAYSFRRLPKLGGYSPREADDRIGYFLTAHVDWSKDPGARDTFDRYINRWQLEKRDPKLALSPPKKPITFIIEKTVPIQWRRWVRQGILDWTRRSRRSDTPTRSSSSSRPTTTNTPTTTPKTRVTTSSAGSSRVGRSRWDRRGPTRAPAKSSTRTSSWMTRSCGRGWGISISLRPPRSPS